MRRNILAIGTIIVIFIVLISLIFFYFNSEGGIDLSKKDCNELNRYLINYILEGNYCNSDSDCIISKEVFPMCGCYILVSKYHDLTNAKRVHEEIGKRINNNLCPLKGCVPCKVPETEDIKCINSKCVVIN